MGAGGPDEILIAGGGIGGLTTALSLARRGIACHVIEQRPAFSEHGFPEDGAGIQIGPNGTRILASLDIADALRPLVGVPHSLRVLDGRSGQPLAELPLGQSTADRHGAPYWVAHRGDLHGTLEAAALNEPLIRMTLSAAVTSARQTMDGVGIELDGAPPVPGRALVAADGIWSRLRSANFDPTPPRFERKSAARTVILRSDAPAGLRANVTMAWLAPGAHVVHYPIRGGREIAIVVIVSEDTASRDWSTDVLPAWVAGHARGFHPSLRQLLDAGTAWRKWSLHTLPVPSRLAAGRMALLGDAAHPVLPFLAQGGVMAIEDAAVLAREVAVTPGDLPAAFERYQRARIPRVAKVAAASRRNGEIYHLGGAMAGARNMAMRALGGRRIVEGYDWLYGWRLPGE